MSKKSSIVSGAGFVAGFFTDLVAEVRRAGGSDEDIYLLSTPDGKPTLAEMARLIVAKSVKSVFPSEAIAADLIPSGWTVMEDVEPTLKSASDLALVPFLDEGEPPICGEEMRRRAKAKKANLGLADLAVALADPTKIAVDTRVYIVFAGTLLRSPVGDHFVACLSWCDGRWVVGFVRVGGGWDGGDRLARCK